MSGRVVAVGGVAVEESIRIAWLGGDQGARIGHRHDLRVGGPAALAAVAAAAAGASARCVGVVGTDPAGVACRRHLARVDVDVTTVVPWPGPTSRILRPADRAGQRAENAEAAALVGHRDNLGDLLLLPGSGWGAHRTADTLAAEQALAGCQPGDALVVEWSAFSGAAPIVEAAYERDLQIVAVLTPYPALPYEFDLRRVDVAVVDTRVAAWLADGGDSAASLCVLVGEQGLSWDGTTIVAPHVVTPTQPVDRAHAVLAGALAARLACGDDRGAAAEEALAMRAAYELGVDPRGGAYAAPWPLLRLDLEELG